MLVTLPKLPGENTVYGVQGTGGVPITPLAGQTVASAKFPSGWLNCGVLNRLKKSPLNAMRIRSVRANVLLTFKSIVFVPAPVNGFLGEVPGAIGVPDASVGTFVKANWSNH